MRMKCAMDSILKANAEIKNILRPTQKIEWKSIDNMIWYANKIIAN